MRAPIFSTLTRCRWFSVLLASLVAITLGGCSPTDFIAQFSTEAAQVTQLVANVGTDHKTFNYALSQE